MKPEPIPTPHTHELRNRYSDDAEDFYGVWVDTGYEWIEAIRKRGWRAIAAWGQDGWNAGDWPYMIFAMKQDERAHSYASYCEGDVRVRSYMTEAELHAALDEEIVWHWQQDPAGHGLPDEIAEVAIQDLPSWLRGPYGLTRDSPCGCPRCSEDQGET